MTQPARVSKLSARFIFSGICVSISLAFFCTTFQREAYGLPGDESRSRAMKPCPRTDDLDFDAATDVHALDKYASVIAGLLKEERFSELDCIANSARANQSRFSGGGRTLHIFYNAVGQPSFDHLTEEDWRNHFRRLEHWLNSNPESITSRIAMAKSYVNYAWDARGDGASDSVSESGWKLFGQRLDKAKQILDRAANLKEKCPEWYVTMQQIARGQDWPDAQKEKLFHDAVAFDPSYELYYRMRAVDLLPKWGGQEGDASRFAQQVADGIGTKNGDILYFQIAKEIVCPCTDPEFKNMSWPRLQKGFEALQSTYGDSLLNWNIFALMATKTNDLVVANTAFEHIGEQWDKGTWITADWFHQQKQAAAAMAPAMARSRAITQEALANLQSSEGTSYKKDFEVRFAKIRQECVEKFPQDLDSFDLYVMVGKTGGVNDAWMTHPTKVAMCMMQELGAAHQRNEIVFPIPPRDSYWMMLPVDPADTNSAAK
jgi:hypothetical protein